VDRISSGVRKRPTVERKTVAASGVAAKSGARGAVLDRTSLHHNPTDKRLRCAAEDLAGPGAVTPTPGGSKRNVESSRVSGGGGTCPVDNFLDGKLFRTVQDCLPVMFLELLLWTAFRCRT
jgi:hypothetical protein